MTIPIYYIPLFYACFIVGFILAILEPPKPVYHWKELKG